MNQISKPKSQEVKRGRSQTLIYLILLQQKKDSWEQNSVWMQTLSAWGITTWSAEMKLGAELSYP